MDDRQRELIAKIEAIEEKLSDKSDAWNRQFILGLGAANGLGLATQAGLLQAAHDPSQAAAWLLYPAVLFVAGLTLAAAAALTAARSAALLSKAHFAQKHAIALDGEFQSRMFELVQKDSRSARVQDRVMWALTILAVTCFACAVVWTFVAAGRGALGHGS